MAFEYILSEVIQAIQRLWVAALPAQIILPDVGRENRLLDFEFLFFALPASSS